MERAVDRWEQAFLDMDEIAHGWVVLGIMALPRGAPRLIGGRDACASSLPILRGGWREARRLAMTFSAILESAPMLELFALHGSLFHICIVCDASTLIQVVGSRADTSALSVRRALLEHLVPA